ncbi:MAG TPA: DUF4838 domain-containing protein [Phycisphaerae bacterium]|nr:DUF4838 domain-containing protein [Phycisphaerae bacterium]HRY70306.1 DUF4838 domain-containing protein [Phycisphaerae bacterium]
MRTSTQNGIVLVAAVYCGIAQAEWRNTLKPAGEPAGKVKVVEAGKAVGVIQCPEKATGPEKKAAADLQQWIKEMTGATLEITLGDARSRGFAIRTDRALGDEGYAIAVDGERIVLTGGKSRGAINAVYALLEEDLGCRFYTNDSIRLPKSGTLVVAPVGRRFIPKLKIRDPFYACAFDPVWSLRNRTNAPNAAVSEEHGGHVDYGGMFVHTAAQMVPPDKYFKDHPEYFAKTADGGRSTNQLCATEPGAVDVAIAYVRQILKDKPHTEILSVSKNDSTEVCHCERCLKLRESEGSDMANQLFLVNRVAEAIEKEYPEVVIDTLAYLETIQVPKTVRPRKNVVIRLCNDAVGSWSHPFTPAERCDVARLASAWSAAHDRISIWDYNVNFSHYLAPMPNLDVIAANVRFWVKNHAEGVMLQGGYQGPAEQDELKCWVASKLLWEPSRDEKALAEDFIWGHYGPAAPAMAEYDALLGQAMAEHAKEMESPAGGIRYSMDAPFITKAFVTKASEILAKAKALAKGDERMVRRVERAELPILYVQCVRGPEFVGDGYAKVVGEFERIARREKIQYLQEGGPDFEPKLAGYKSRISEPTGGK